MFTVPAADPPPPPPPPPPFPPPPAPPSFLPPPPPRSRRHPASFAIVVASVAVAAGLVMAVWLATSHRESTQPAVAGVDRPAVAAMVNVNGVVPNGRVAGTGIILTSGGLVLTNNHVVAGTTSLTADIAGGGGPVYQAIVLGVDPTQDVAVIQLAHASGLPVGPIDSSGALTIGDHVTGLGNAMGLDGAPIPATGTVTSLDETIDVHDESGTIRETLDGVICFSAAIQPGDSGGPLLNTDGRIVGMDTAGSLSTAPSASSHRGCAIPISRAIGVAHQIESGASSPYIESGHSGILGVGVSDQPRVDGAVVDEVIRGGGADRSGLVPGDVIIGIDAAPVHATSDLSTAMKGRRPGDHITLTWRDPHGAAHSIDAALGPGPPA